MERIYTIEDAKRKMEKSVIYYQERINAWQQVKRVYKKDGGIFQNLNKNFENATLLTEYHINKIRVCFKSAFEGYINDDIYLNDIVFDGKQETYDAIEKKIQKTIANYKKWMEIDKKGLEEIETQINNCIPFLDSIKAIIEDAKQNTNTHYTLQAYIKEYLHIL